VCYLFDCVDTPKDFFSFGKKLHRVTNTIENALEERKVCSVLLLDVVQAFVRVWHEELVGKLNTVLPRQHTDTIKSDTYSDLKEMTAGEQNRVAFWARSSTSPTQVIIL
jgi:hypothetical protein